MAAHNIAIEVDPPDGDSLHEYDVEIGSSRTALVHSFEEERALTLSTSIHKSIQTTLKRTRRCTKVILTPFRFLLSKFKLLFVIACYSVFGAWMFMTLEVPTDLAAKEEAYHARLIARDVMILNLRAIHQNNKEDREERWRESILNFENDLGLDEPALESAWTFWMAFLYAGTIYTTIGYGNIACATTAGKVATMLYSMVGIPIMLLILNDLGSFLLVWMKRLANYSSDFLLFIGVRVGAVGLKEGSEQRIRYICTSKKLAKAGLISVVSLASIVTQEEELDGPAEEPVPDPPVFSAICATVAWILLAAAVFCIWEDWSYFTSIYFFFISCSTIGLGDVTPAHPEYMIATFGVVMVGLSLVSVCIDVVKEKLELLYMALLKKMLQDYMEAVKNGDPNATAGMMAGFKGKAKFLMPLLSKDQGARVMSRFKEDCTAKGIDPPAVLVDLNPNTGMPAFANANREEFNDFIETAVERRADEEKKELQRFSQLLEHNAGMRKSFEELSRASPKNTTKFLHTIDSQSQTTPMPPHKDTTSRATQIIPSLVEFETQTILLEFSEMEVQTIPSSTSPPSSTSFGVQINPTMMDAETQMNAKKFNEFTAQTADKSVKNSWTQYEQKQPIMKTTAVQPEVSQIVLRESDSLQGEAPGEEDRIVGETAAVTETLRFLKSVGEQVDLPTTEQLKAAAIESATQSEEVTSRAQHTQTKLSSIDSREIMAIKELRKRRPRGLSLASPSHSRRFSSFPSSTSDFGNGSVTTSGHYHTIESSTDVESTSAGEHVEEVTVTVSFVKKPVDELGVEVVDMTDTYAVEDDDVFLQEAELDEVERFVVEEGTQTVDLGMQVQAIDTELTESSSQTSPAEEQIEPTSEPSRVDSEMQTVFSSYTESSMQTSPLLLLSEEVQTIDERPTTESVDCQTDEAVLATQSTSYAAQTEVSMFTVKKEDRSALEAEHQVRFNVDNSTSMERKLYSSIAVQNFGPKTSSIPVQCVQEVCSTETQSASCSTVDEWSQTEICMKNKKNQECEATVETRDASEQSIFALVDSIVQAVTLQSDCGVDSPLLSATNSTVQTEAPLWSDFDRILLEEPYDASEQTSPVARCDAVSSCEVEISSTAVQTAKEATAEQECDVRVEMGDGEVQAVVESNEIASGLSDCDNWLKVYLAELDDEKRQRMMDIGIQTGVLARVQHMYGNHASLEADGLITADSSRPAIRLVEFDDGTPNLGDGGESSNRPSPSSTSLPQSPVDRLATSPQSSRTVIRRQSLKRSQPSIDVSRRVSDLRARFEKSKKSDGDGAGLVRARSSSLER